MPLKDREARREAARLYYQKTKERDRAKRREATRRWTAANKEQKAAKAKEWWDRNPEKRAEYHKAKLERPGEREKERARAHVRERVHRGKWPAAGFFKCSDCSAQAQHYHHEDYGQWWNVEPLCIDCHAKRHQSNRATSSAA